MDRENRKLPEVEIEGTIFQFDIDRLALIEKNDPSNTITFAYMEDHGTHYSFNYSPLAKNHDFIVTDPEFDDTGKMVLDPYFETSIEVVIPRITEIDPLGFMEKYNCTSKDMVEKTDFELMVDQEIYNKRIDGHPVTVNICGNKYVVDPDNDILWSMEGKPDIDLESMEHLYNERSRSYGIFYDAITGNVIDISKESKMDSDNVRLVVVPHIRTLDPIGKNHAESLPIKLGLIYHDLKLEYELPFSFEEVRQVIPIKRNELGQIELLIEGTSFVADIDTFEYRNKSNPENKIQLKDMQDNEEGGYTIIYNNKELFIPEFVKLDPEGMAKKYNVSIDEVVKHDDFFFMVDQKAFDMRMQGQLPTLDIEGHTFTVDIRMNMLRSATDFALKSISFDEIDDYYSEEKDTYIIPYDPIKKEFRELDYDNLFSIPKDLIAIEFPFQQKLDPIGWNRAGGWDLKDNLKWLGVRNHFEAKTIPWEQTYIVDIIRDNKEELQKRQENQQKDKPKNQSKGRKM